MTMTCSNVDCKILTVLTWVLSYICTKNNSILIFILHNYLYRSRILFIYFTFCISHNYLFRSRIYFFIFCILYCAQLFCQEQDIYFIFYILHNYFCPKQDIHFIFCTIIFAGAGYIFYIFYFIFHIIFYILQNYLCRSRIYPELVFLGQSKEPPPHLR